jgi:hypothetical protein
VSKLPPVLQRLSPVQVFWRHVTRASPLKSPGVWSRIQSLALPCFICVKASRIFPTWQKLFHITTHLSSFEVKPWYADVIVRPYVLCNVCRLHYGNLEYADAGASILIGIQFCLTCCSMTWRWAFKNIYVCVCHRTVQDDRVILKTEIRTSNLTIQRQLYWVAGRSIMEKIRLGI